MTRSNTITKHLKWLLLNRSRVRQCTVHFIMDHFTEFELDVRTRSVNTCREHQKVAHLPIREQNKALVRGVLKRGGKQHPLCLDHGGLSPHHLRVATIHSQGQDRTKRPPRHSKGTVENTHGPTLTLLASCRP